VRHLLLLGLSAGALFAQGQCRVAVTPSSDYNFLVGSGDSGGGYRWLRNGQAIASGTSPQLFLMHADGSLTTAEGKTPLRASGVQYVPGRWGSGIALDIGGALTYALAGALDWNEGTIEMWVAARADGSDPVYAAHDHVLFQYRAASSDRMSITQSGSAGILYAGGNVNGQWESAYGGGASTRLWQAGEWHHIAFTWSAGASSMQFYVDGVKTADTNEKHYWPPEASGDFFSLGDDGYWIDEIRISAQAMSSAQVRANAERLDQPKNYEVWLPLAGSSPGDSITLEMGAGCSSAAFVYNGVPVTNADPPSTLLAPGATSLALTVQSSQPTSCAYSVGAVAGYSDMTAFDTGQGATSHGVTLQGLSPDPAVVNHVYVRCASDPDFVLPLLYRSLAVTNAHFPRKGNLWGSSQVSAPGLAHAARIDLFLGASFTPAEIRAVRALNPNVLVLTSINTVENSGVPEDYYLHDIRGKRIEVWPGTYRLNLTKPYVAEYQARFAYQQVLDSGLLLDGCFFDNFFTTQSWLKTDIHGNAVQIDANEDGIEDDPKWLDAAWHDGVYHELQEWRKLMPNALASGHLPRPPQPEFSTIFNGDSIGFLSPQTADGSVPFQNFWDAYQNWWSIGRQPLITMVEGAPPYQIGYGYDYDPLQKIPPSTLEFARTYYPYVRYGLAFTLLNDGYFAYEFGDTYHGNDWWYDELDFDLGYPLGAVERVAMGTVSTANMLDNGSFESPLSGTWYLVLDSAVKASVAQDPSTHEEGSASAHIAITTIDGTDWHVNLEQRNRHLQQGFRYDLSFWAKADAARQIRVNSQRNSPDWRNYGLSAGVAIGTDWKQYSVTFEANETVDDARIEFYVGAQRGDVWLDDVRLVQHPADVFRRDFSNGTVILNGTRQRQTVVLEPGFQRLTGSQAPRHEYILDDSGPEFSASKEWRVAQYDSGMWKDAGPFYHTWGAGCHQLDGATGTAQWDLALRGDDTYTIDVWWAAAPQSANWSRKAVFEVVAGGKVVASTTMDQTTGGDQWHTIATVPLAVADAPIVRVHNEGSGSVIADALHVRSAARYNDGSAAASVTLEPMDGIVLRRTSPQ
jgi:hypothetical protein